LIQACITQGAIAGQNVVLSFIAESR